MIKHIKLKFGRAPGITAEGLTTTPITMFVGPNNSGKSKVLQEMYEYCISGQRNLANVILDHIEFQGFSPAKAEAQLGSVTLDPNPDEPIYADQILVGKRDARHRIHGRGLLEVLQEPTRNLQMFCRYYLSYNTLKLDGASRIGLVNQQAGGDLQHSPHTSFQVLFRDDLRRAEVRRIIHEAFGLFLTIDPTQLGQLRLRLATRAPHSNLEERGIHDEAVRYHASALPIERSSDGVKAFTGMITEIIAGDPQVILIDEPEAFLHPALASTLGKEIAVASLGSERRLFVSTHSPNFVMGCIQSGAPVNIMRLTYRNGVATARLLPSEDILRLMRNPLLRSTGVLSGLFYEFIIVTESDADRAFYQEINERLVRYNPELAIPNCLFLNAQNKQTVRTIIRPLRALGIPVAGVVDIDVLKEGGSVWTDFLSSGFVPEAEHQSLGSLRCTIKQKLVDSGKDMKRDGGIEILSESDREAASNLLDRLSQYGLFVVRRGQLESWLPQFNSPGHGPAWLIDVFEKMGEDPDSINYLRPTTGDVWGFVGSIKAWLTDPSRRGIPS